MNSNRIISGLFITLLGCGLSFCTKDRLENINFLRDNSTDVDTSGNVVINEFIATGSTHVNEYGFATDWIELYNTGDKDIDFSKTNHYITDDSTKPDKFLINKLIIPAKGFMVVFCDDSAKIATQVHTNFGLSKEGEFLGLYKKNSSGSWIQLTGYLYGPQISNRSEGRLPDGGLTWTTFSVPTPGKANKL